MRTGIPVMPQQPAGLDRLSILNSFTTQDFDQLIEFQRRLNSGVSANDSSNQSTLQFLTNLSNDVRDSPPTTPSWVNKQHSFVNFLNSCRILVECTHQQALGFKFMFASYLSMDSFTSVLPEWFRVHSIEKGEGGSETSLWRYCYDCQAAWSFPELNCQSAFIGSQSARLNLLSGNSALRSIYSNTFLDK